MQKKGENVSKEGEVTGFSLTSNYGIVNYYNLVMMVEDFSEIREMRSGKCHSELVYLFLMKKRRGKSRCFKAKQPQIQISETSVYRVQRSVQPSP